MKITLPYTGTITSNITIDVTEAVLKTYTVTINQTDNQTITVTCNGVEYTDTFTANHGDTYTAVVTAVEGYNAGALSSSSGTITENITISATEASKNMFAVTINQIANQTITVNDGTTDYTSSFTAAYGTKLTATVTADEGYTAGTLNQTEVTVTGAVSFSVSEATLNSYTLSITQSDNQTITVTANGTEYTSSVKLPYGTAWTASIEASEGYIAGTLTETSGTITEDTRIAATEASLKIFTVTINQKDNQTIHVYVPNKSDANAVDHTTTFTATYGTTFEPDIVANDGYTAGELSVEEA